MADKKNKELIGIGIYTLQEASLYGGISSHKLSRWVFGTANCSSVIDSTLSSQRLISFYDLVQTMAINMAREQGIPLSKIRQAIKFVQDEHNISLPLAYDHRLLWFDNELHIKLPTKAIHQASGKIKGQIMMRIVEPFMRDLHFDPEGVVTQFTPFNKYGRQVILDPKRQFGQPLVGNTGYRADVLDRAHSIEQSHELVASIYNIDVKDVKTAVAYMKTLRTAA